MIRGRTTGPASKPSRRPCRRWVTNHPPAARAGEPPRHAGHAWMRSRPIRGRQQLCRAAHEGLPKRAIALALALAASTARSRGSAVVTSARIRVRADSATSCTARSNASSLALDGRLKPLSLRTNCSEASRISSSVAGGSKLKSVLMLRHMVFGVGWRMKRVSAKALPQADLYPGRPRRARKGLAKQDQGQAEKKAGDVREAM